MLIANALRVLMTKIYNSKIVEHKGLQNAWFDWYHAVASTHSLHTSTRLLASEHHLILFVHYSCWKSSSTTDVQIRLETSPSTQSCCCRHFLSRRFGLRPAHLLSMTVRFLQYLSMCPAFYLVPLVGLGHRSPVSFQWLSRGMHRSSQYSAHNEHTHSSFRPVPGTAGSVYDPHSRHILVTKVMRCWQTAAVYGAHNRTFSFDVHGESPLPTILRLVCPPSSYWTLRVVPFHRIDKLCRVEMQQLEDPDQLAHHWPPPPAVHWSFRAWHHGTEQPFLHLVLEFALLEALQHSPPPEGVFLGEEVLNPYNEAT